MQYDTDENCRNVVYSSNATGMPQLYMVPTNLSSKPKQITSGKEPVFIVYLTRKGDNLIYLKDIDGNEIFELFLLPIKGGTGKKITTTPYRTLGVDLHPNGKEVTRSFVSATTCGLETINLENGECFVLKETKPLPYMDFHYSNDGKWLACTNIKSFINTEVVVFNRNDPSDTIFYTIDDKSRNGHPSWSPDDNKLAFISEATGWGRVVIQNFQKDERITLNLGKDEGVPSGSHIIWNPKGTIVYYAVSKHSRIALHEHPINGEKRTAMPFPEGTVEFPKISKDGKKILVLHSSMISPLGVYLYEIGTKSVTPLTPRDFKVDLNLLQKPQSIWYDSFDAKKIHAWYIPAVDAKEPYPAVMYIHGGPWNQVEDSWMHGIFMQPLSQSGFATLGPNFRGSIGYGSEFQNLNIGDPGGGDLEDVVCGADWLKKRSEIDASKIAIMGGSYGGYITLMALTKKSDVFAAGVALVPVVDWLEKYELSDMYTRLVNSVLLGGIPTKKEVKELYIDRSPITHVSNIKVPVMIMAGKADSRCPIGPIEKFIKKLEEKNHPYEFVLEEKAGHISALTNWDQSVRIFMKMLDYLNEHLP